MTDPNSSSALTTSTELNLRESLGICPNQLTMTVLMSPDMANLAGNVHGGSILKLLDQVAYACAARYAGGYVVTLSVDQVTFLKPVHVGELLTLLASVNYTGRTSMEVGIKVLAEEIHKGVIRHTNSCFFTMVAVDAEGHSVPVRPLQPQTDEEHRRFRAAIERRTLRAEMAPCPDKGKIRTFGSLNAVSTRP